MLGSYFSCLRQTTTEFGGDVGHPYAHYGGLVQEEGVGLSRASGAGGGMQGVDRTTPIVLLADLFKQLDNKNSESRPFTDM